MMAYFEIYSGIESGSTDLADLEVGNANLRELDQLRQQIGYSRSPTQLEIDSISHGLSALKQSVNALTERLDSDAPIVFSILQWQPGMYPNLAVHESSQLSYHEYYQLEIPYFNSPNETNNHVWSEYGSSETHIACSIPEPVVDCEDSLNVTLPLEVRSDELNMNDDKLQSDDDFELTHSDINLSFNLDSLHHSSKTNWRTKSLEQIRAENIIKLKKREQERAARLARDPNGDYPVCFNCGAKFYWGHPCTERPILIEEQEGEQEPKSVNDHFTVTMLTDLRSAVDPVLEKYEANQTSQLSLQAEKQQAIISGAPKQPVSGDAAPSNIQLDHHPQMFEPEHQVYELNLKSTPLVSHSEGLNQANPTSRVDLLTIFRKILGADELDYLHSFSPHLQLLQTAYFQADKHQLVDYISESFDYSIGTEISNLNAMDSIGYFQGFGPNIMHKSFQQSLHQFANSFAIISIDHCSRLWRFKVVDRLIFSHGFSPHRKLSWLIPKVTITSVKYTYILYALPVSLQEEGALPDQFQLLQHNYFDFLLGLCKLVGLALNEWSMTQCLQQKSSMESYIPVLSSPPEKAHIGSICSLIIPFQGQDLSMSSMQFCRILLQYIHGYSPHMYTGFSKVVTLLREDLKLLNDCHQNSGYYCWISVVLQNYLDFILRFSLATVLCHVHGFSPHCDICKSLKFLLQMKSVVLQLNIVIGRNTMEEATWEEYYISSIHILSLTLEDKGLKGGSNVRILTLVRERCRQLEWPEHYMFQFLPLSVFKWLPRT